MKVKEVWIRYTFVVIFATVIILCNDDPSIWNFLGAMFQSEGAVGFWMSRRWSTFYSILITSLYGDYVLACVEMLMITVRNHRPANQVIARLVGFLCWILAVPKLPFPQLEEKKFEYTALTISGLTPGLSWFGISYGLDRQINPILILMIVGGANVVKNAFFATMSLAFGKHFVVWIIVGFALLIKIGIPAINRYAYAKE